MSDLKDDLEFGDSALYASFDAFKTMIDAGVSRKEAIERVGLTEQIVKDLEEEEGSEEFKDEFKEVWAEDESDYDDEWGGGDDDKWNDDEEWNDDELGGDSGYDSYDD